MGMLGQTSKGQGHNTVPWWTKKKRKYSEKENKLSYQSKLGAFDLLLPYRFML